MRVRRVGQHTFEQSGQHRLDSRFPTAVDDKHFAEPPRFIQAQFRQPFACRRFFLSERGVLQGFQRGETPTQTLQFRACLVELRRIRAFAFQRLFVRGAAFVE